MGASDGATGATTEQGAPVSGLTEAAPDRDFGAALLDTAQTLICVLDREGCIVRFNRACEEATGFTSEEVVGRRAVDFVIPPEDADAFAAWLDEVWSSRAPNPQQGHWMTKSGGRRLIAWANRPLVDDDGAVRLLVTSGLDITERESAASELWSLQAQLHDRLEELSRLAAEQAALRRVATIVARERAPEEVFEAVTQEAGRLLGAESSALLAYSADHRVGTIVGRWTEADTGAFPVGTVLPVEGENSLTVTVARTGKAGRINDYTDISGEAARRIRAYGFHSVVAAPVVVGARVWGLLIVATQRPEPLVEGAERRLDNFAELVALALGSADARNELAASRVRIVEAADAARRRLERDLHDGAQQRLVALSMTLRLARARVEQNDPAAASELLESAGDELQQGLEQLREVARGIHPALLSERGLRPALEALAARAPFPVELDVVDERFAHAVEVAVYYLVSEALTNAAKYAEPSVVTTTVAREHDGLVAQITDDGRGGADPAGGTGLRGLADRVAALGGKLHIDSLEGAGTVVRAELPLGRPPPG
jgi:PAS domain S-box-containing protein